MPDPTKTTPAHDHIVEAIAAEAFAVLNTERQVAPFSKRFPGLGLDDAYRVTAAVRDRRAARGERPIGRKIGFTNRTIWAEYDVHAPIWGYVYDSTVHDLSAQDGPFLLTGLAEPRIEPEIVFGMGETPRPGMAADVLLGCIEWVAHGFEIVQSIFPGWRFAAEDTIAAYGLHGALFIGPKHHLSAGAGSWRQTLNAFEILLFRDDLHIDHGRAENVLGGPVFALSYLVALLGRDTHNPPLAAGEIVTTGTLTRAFPVKPGETWSTALTGIDVEGARLRFA